MNNTCFNKTIQKYKMIEDNDKIVIGLSGGADSVCLTTLLNSIKEKYNLNLVAAHINHGIRGEEADRDEDFCKQLCQKLGIELEILHADIPTIAKQQKISEEECGRKIRYEFFSSLAGETGKIATAHNLNDNAETVILNIIRGSANKGLCGIPPVRENIIRPLIETSREDIENYCKVNNFTFITDSSNLHNDYNRNKIRNIVLPVFKEINPSVISSFSRLISSSTEDEMFFEQLTDEAYLKSVNNNKINEYYFNNLNPVLKKRIIAKFLKTNLAHDISSKHIEDVLQIVGTGKQINTVNSINIRSRNGFLEIVNDKAIDNWCVNIKKEQQTVILPFGNAKINFLSQKDLQNLHKEVLDNVIDCDKINNTLSIRSRKEGDLITLPKRKVTKSLKKLFNEEKIAPEKRNTVCVLACNDSVIWVEGFGTSTKYCVNNQTRTAMQIIIQRGKENG